MTICSCGAMFKTERIGLVWLQKSEGRPYALWGCDKMLCKECDTYVYVTAEEPMAFQHETGFDINLRAAEIAGILVGSEACEEKSNGR